MISLLTERFFPCRRRLPLSLITKEQRHKKNGEKRLFFEDFSVLLLTFFQLNCCRRPQLATWDIYAYRQDITMPLMPLPLVTIYKRVMQKERWVFVQNHFFTVISTHHFFQLNCCRRPQLATWDIYAHRQDINHAPHATPSHSNIRSGDAKRTVS